MNGMIGALVNEGTGSISSIENRGVIGGGMATALSNAGTIGTLTNLGTIAGGAGGFGGGNAGVLDAGTIGTLTNSGAITGGAGGSSDIVKITSHGSTVVGSIGEAGGAGISNSGTITSLANSATIAGGAGGAGSGGGAGGAGGAGISNAGTIASLTNSGLITGGAGGSNGGAMGDAIYSAGAKASIGPIANSGQIIGNVEIDNQANVSITGGIGATYGSWTGGTITVGNGNLTFAGGNTALGDNIVVSGTVFNDDPLMISTPITITGDYDQSASGVLDFGLAGDLPGEYGSLTITGLATLDGSVAIDLTQGFKLSAGETFDLLASEGLSADLSGFSFDGAACSAHSSDVWTCAGVTFEDVIGAGSLDLDVLETSAVPEPSTWALLATGFLGLAGLRLRRRGRLFGAYAGPRRAQRLSNARLPFAST